MKIQYINHSGFAITAPKATMIFDYSRGDVPAPDPSLPVYVFVSHVHSDHFNPQVADKLQQVRQVIYVLSSDIPARERDGLKQRHQPSQDVQIVCVDAGMTVDLPDMTVQTLKSTDAGVAFIIEIEGKRIYFAGDLHWWTWIGEIEAAEQAMKDAFMCEMDKIKGMAFDAAFLVLDPRQEERYWWGFDYFMRNTKTAKAFPMHCWGKYDLVDQLIADKRSETYRDAIVPIHQKGEIFGI